MKTIKITRSDEFVRLELDTEIKTKLPVYYFVHDCETEDAAELLKNHLISLFRGQEIEITGE